VRQDEFDLPGIITGVTPQKKRRGRWSIYVEREFLIDVDDAVLLKNNLHEGVEMTPSLFRKLQREEGRQNIKAYLLKLLSQRAHSRLELFTKASMKDFDPDVVNDVLEELGEKNFINDREFAKKFAHDKNHLNDWGPAKILARLRQKGIDRQTAEEAVEKAFEKVDVGVQLRKLIKKRKRHFMKEEDPFKRKKKMTNYLQRKGYYASDIFEHLDVLADVFMGR
jgi:regulatory protein